MKFSLIVSTKGRVDQLKTLFRSMEEQTCQDFEVIISDQNDDDRLESSLLGWNFAHPLLHRKSSAGASRGRNEGIARAAGEIFGFPDDDCAYPPGLLANVAQFFDQNPEYGFVCGRSINEKGEDAVTRHAKNPSRVQRATVHAQSIEFAFFIRRSALGELRYDENMGVGAATPWHSDEGPDLILRLAEKGVHGFYNPALEVFHPSPVTRFDARDIDRTYRYACGNGYFYRKHGYSFSYFARQMARTSCGVLLALMTGHLGKARLYLARLQGRWRGWKEGRGAGTRVPESSIL